MQPWLTAQPRLQRLPNRGVRAWQLCAQLALAQLATTVVEQAPEQRLRPKSAVSLPAVKASINTAEYISRTSCNKGKPTHAMGQTVQKAWSHGKTERCVTCFYSPVFCTGRWKSRWWTFLILSSVKNSKDSQKKSQQQFGQDAVFFPLPFRLFRRPFHRFIYENSKDRQDG